MWTNLFLTAVGLLYVGLAIWCTVDPATTSQKVGFELKPGSGPNEFVTVYGGLEMALAVVLLLCWLSPSFSFHALTTCVIFHACMVVFRTYSFVALPTDGIQGLTYRLATGEWILFLSSGVILINRLMQSSNGIAETS